MAKNVVVEEKVVEKAKPAEIKAEEVVEKKPAIDAAQVTFFVWILYKMNMITRIQVRDFLEMIRAGQWPEDVVKYLADEVKKI